MNTINEIKIYTEQIYNLAKRAVFVNPTGYHEFLESWRDVLPHDGKYNPLAKFVVCLSFVHKNLNECNDTILDVITELNWVIDGNTEA